MVYTHTYTHTHQNDEVGELGVSQANISFFDFFLLYLMLIFLNKDRGLCYTPTTSNEYK